MSKINNRPEYEDDQDEPDLDGVDRADGHRQTLCKECDDLKASRDSLREELRRLYALPDRFAVNEAMKEALKATQAALGWHGPCRNNDCAACVAAYKKARAALKLAEGEP